MLIHHFSFFEFALGNSKKKRMQKCSKRNNSSYSN